LIKLLFRSIETKYYQSIMKSSNSSKGGRQSKKGAAYLAARAAEADKQADVARGLARLAKAKFKDARKAFKQAKKFAKQARKEAKTAASTLKKQIKRARRISGKKVGSVSRRKSVHPKKNPLSVSKSPKRTKLSVPVPGPASDSAPPVVEGGQAISQA
jgi:hypothetical protein